MATLAKWCFYLFIWYNKAISIFFQKKKKQNSVNHPGPISFLKNSTICLRKTFFVLGNVRHKEQTWVQIFCICRWTFVHSNSSKTWIKMEENMYLIKWYSVIKSSFFRETIICNIILWFKKHHHRHYFLVKCLTLGQRWKIKITGLERLTVSQNEDIPSKRNKDWSLPKRHRGQHTDPEWPKLKQFV